MSSFLNICVPAEIFDRARLGDRAAQERLYRLMARPTYTLLRRLVARPAIAEELLHEVFIDVLNKINACKGAESFAGWVRSIAVSQALMYLRSPWQQGRLPAGATQEPLQWTATVPAEDWSAELERALNALPTLSRSIVWLHDVEGYTHSEIAQLFGHTISFSKSQLARAHGALRAHLESSTGAVACTQASRS